MADIEQAASKALELTQGFERDWSKKLKNSAAKSREWLYKHAIEIYEFRKACNNKELELPASAKLYFEAKMLEWLGYQDKTARQWATVGKFIVEISNGTRETVASVRHRLPLSHRALLEFSSMTDAEIQQADSVGLVDPDTTVEEIRDFKASLKQAKTEQEDIADKKHAEAKAQAEEALLTFKYTDKVPEWIIGRIEDLAAQMGAKAVASSPTLKFKEDLPNSQPAVWVCTLVKETWDATQVLAEQPKAEPKEYDKPSEPKRESVKQHDEVIISRASEFYWGCGLLGVNLNNGYIEPWAIKALLEAAQATYSSQDILDELPQAAEAVKRK